jgi:hypothetical protein
MDVLQVLALVAFLCAAVLAALPPARSWPLALTALGLALWLVSTTDLIR